MDFFEFSLNQKAVYPYKRADNVKLKSFYVAHCKFTAGLVFCIALILNQSVGFMMFGQFGIGPFPSSTELFNGRSRPFNFDS